MGVAGDRQGRDSALGTALIPDCARDRGRLTVQVDDGNARQKTSGVFEWKHQGSWKLLLQHNRAFRGLTILRTGTEDRKAAERTGTEHLSPTHDLGSLAVQGNEQRGVRGQDRINV